jgi:hypothetical protein
LGGLGLGGSGEVESVDATVAVRVSPGGCSEVVAFGAVVVAEGG